MKLKSRTSCLCLSVALCALPASGAAKPAKPAKPEPTMMLFSLKKSRPVIDGNLGDECWKGAQVATGFMPLGKIEKARVDTQVMSTYDNEKLYFGIKCFEPSKSPLKAVPGSPWQGDAIELFLEPRGGGKSFYQIVVDCQGNVFATADGGAHEAKLPVEAAARRFDGFWTFEIAVPFAALNSGLPKDNEHWAFNVGRERATVSPQEISSWSALGAFRQWEKFGKLAFYSKWEVEAAMAYWANSDADPLMRVPIVSGYDIARNQSGHRSASNLWYYDPYAVDRVKNARWNCQGLMGTDRQGTLLAKQKYPAFYQAAMGLNRLLIDKARTDDAIAQLNKATAYAQITDSKPASPGGMAASSRPCLFWVSGQRHGREDAAMPPGTEKGPMAKIQKKSDAIDTELNALYETYGRAFGQNYDSKQLAGVDSRIEKAAGQMKDLNRQIAAELSALAEEAKRQTSWPQVSLAIPPGEKKLNADGTDERLSFVGMRFWGNEEPFRMLGTYDSINCDWPQGLADSPAPNKYDYRDVDNFIAALKKKHVPPRINLHTLFGSYYEGPFPAWLAQKAEGDPDIVLKGQDGRAQTPKRVWGSKEVCYLNSNNPDVIAFAKDYLKNLAAHLDAQKAIHFFITGWEDLNAIVIGGGQFRSAGYNPSNKTAFRGYLKERYGSIDVLNAKWKTSYASFDVIEPPTDKYIQPAKQASGLTYEFERWSRVDHVRYNAMLRQALKAGAPNVPVMIDDSWFLREMNGYLLFKENAADIYSFHSNPGDEDAMWAYLNSMQRRFGKVLGYHENYWAMYRRAHSDERLARRDIRSFFYQMYLRDIRLSTWWLRYEASPTDYAVAYGGGTFNLDYDQTIFRWSSAELAPMFERGRAMERAILESKPETPTTAVIQPCATVFTLASLGRNYRSSPVAQAMMDLHYKVLAAGNYPYDILPEEMVLDGKGSLNEYKLLFLPYAPYMSQEFSMRLKDWTAKGGTLVAIGPFALMNEYGQDLPAASSVMKSMYPKVRKIGSGDWQYSLNGTTGPITALAETKRFGEGTVVYLNLYYDSYVGRPALLEPLRRTLARAAKRSATSNDSDLKILVREGPAGTRYLALCNRSVEKPLNTMVKVNGRYATALDVLVPGAFPVPSHVTDNRTNLRVHLDPGDWTLISLRKE